MTYDLILTSAYKKGYKRMKKRGMDMSLLDNVVDKLRKGETLDAQKYDVHKLQGKYAGFYDCHIAADWVLIYLIEDDILTLTLSDTGTHQDIKGWGY